MSRFDGKCDSCGNPISIFFQHGDMDICINCHALHRPKMTVFQKERLKKNEAIIREKLRQIQERREREKTQSSSNSVFQVLDQFTKRRDSIG